jgi:hypothetical protein
MEIKGKFLMNLKEGEHMHQLTKVVALKKKKNRHI